MLRISQLAVLTAVSTAAGAASAPCPEESRGTLDERKCYGEVEYASRMEGEDFAARFVLFENAERLYEKRDSAGTKMRLMGRGWQLYRGLDREDSTVVGRHDPFIFFEFALITPLVALAASGQPPSALAQGPTLVAYTTVDAHFAAARDRNSQRQGPHREARRALHVRGRLRRECPDGIARDVRSRTLDHGDAAALAGFDAASRPALSLRADKRRRS